MNEARVQKLLVDAAKKFGLSLGRFSVLTEAATGYFSLTPLLAAIGGSPKVYALAKDSVYGKGAVIGQRTMELADHWGLSEQIEIVFARNDGRLADADIVTNLGSVRPIDAELIFRFKKTVAIPLMWETWEFRPQDVDLALCRLRGIPVLGTNEHHPDLNIFMYIGHVVLKLLYELEIEIFRSNLVIVGSGEFASVANSTLSAAGAKVDLVEASKLGADHAKSLIGCADAIIVLEHVNRQELIGEKGLVTPETIKTVNPAVVIAHVCGAVDQRGLEVAGIKYAPARLAPAGYMSVSTAYLGPRPLIDLHAAGLKVGQAMAEAVADGLCGIEAEKRALESCAYAQGFADRY